ncbi:threonine aldolase family protein [Paenibacillus dauci]|uniref:threonine aldolase family protein n=1 Tax=Paenibacillus dauci TaxID=1567106 RepID=UPI000619DB23|nr:aminotransferase class V-fold PLP-dependent enzyme [Paenibacillus dauci]
MISFLNDYSEGAHPDIMQALQDTNLVSTIGYGLDEYCTLAADRIREAIQSEQAQVHFLVGGTQANRVLISSALRPHEAVITALTGHVVDHETGAIEASGHKVLTIPAPQGKLTPELAERLRAAHNSEHMVKPRMVYVSNSTEIGTFYSLQELEDLSAYCRTHQLYFFLDGARLGSALTAPGNDVTLSDLARLTDAFYIGGTKNGALFGEALVLVNPALQQDFRHHIKQNGAMLAKGRLLGIQFAELFRDQLYFRIAAHANAMAALLKQAITQAGYSFMIDSNTNQLFPILPNEILEKLRSRYLFSHWEKVSDTHSVIRLVTSWATSEEDVQAFAEELLSVSGAAVSK